MGVREPAEVRNQKARDSYWAAKQAQSNWTAEERTKHEEKLARKAAQRAINRAAAAAQKLQDIAAAAAVMAEMAAGT